jgi:large subunit ribosomal protein L21e
MTKGKKIREKGKLKLSCYFKKIEKGDKVAISLDRGVRANFSKRIIGKSGEVIGSRGNFNVVEVKEGNKKKTFILHPVHLRRLQ